jgi:hypothetical protein
MHYRHITTIKQAVYGAIIHTQMHHRPVHKQKAGEKSEKKGTDGCKSNLSSHASSASVNFPCFKTGRILSIIMLS